jgi:preprotein translocase subunit YajC
MDGFSGGLSVLISPAYAQAAGAASQSDTLLTFLPMIAIFVVFYFLLIRPQQKKAKESRAMLEALEKGNEVVTAGGIVGRITRLTDQYAAIEVAPNIEMTVQRGAISQLLPKGTIKTL